LASCGHDQIPAARPSVSGSARHSGCREERGNRYLDKNATTEAVGIPPKSKAASESLCIPFTNGTKGACRYLAEGAKPKIKQAAGVRNCFYEAPLGPDSKYTIQEAKGDTSMDLYILESPLKALAVAWHGLPAIGINGVYGWMSDHKPIPDFDEWQWVGRLVVLCFDSDVVSKAQVRQALKRLADHLKSLGARVKIKLLPSRAGKSVGADDYIAKYGIAKFLALRVRAL
jgi:hypothetical protein